MSTESNQQHAPGPAPKDAQKTRPSFGVLRIRVQRRRRMQARIWERLNSNIVLWALTMFCASLIPFIFTWWSNNTSAAYVASERRFIIALELYERIANAGAAPEDLPSQRERILLIVDERESHSRPEFQGVSTMALYVEWCRLAGDSCKISPAALRADFASIRGLRPGPQAPPWPSNTFALVVDEVNYALEWVNLDIVLQTAKPEDMELRGGPNGSIVIETKHKASPAVKVPCELFNQELDASVTTNCNIYPLK